MGLKTKFYATLSLLIFFLNVLYLIFGIALINIGVDLYLEAQSYFNILGNIYLYISGAIIIISVIIVLVACFGCCGVTGSPNNRLV